MTTTPATLIRELRELHAKATPGEWWFTGATIRANRPYSPLWGVPGEVKTRICFGFDGSQEQRKHDYGLIVALKNGLPTLLDTIERLTAERDAEHAALRDQVTVHVNMLRGGIAKPSPANIWHIYRAELLDAMPADLRAKERDAAAREAFEEAARIAESDDLILSESRRAASFGKTRKDHGALIASQIRQRGR